MVNFTKLVFPDLVFFVDTCGMGSKEWVYSYTEAIGYVKWTLARRYVKWQDSMLNGSNEKHGDKDTIILSKTRNC